MEKRKRKRIPKRLNVRFGQGGEFPHTGFTKDLSQDGAFIASGNIPPVGTRVQLQLMLGPTRCLFFEAVVCRQRQVPQHLRQVEQAGFGVCFRSLGDLFQELFPVTAQTNRFEVHYADPLRLQDAWKQELVRGGVFVRTERLLQRDAQVNVSIHLDWVNRSFEFISTVVQAVSAPGATGLALSFRDPAALRAALAPFLGPPGSPPQ